MEKRRSVRQIDFAEILSGGYIKMGKTKINIVPSLKIHAFNTHTLLL
jgi:hypothetical protein